MVVAMVVARFGDQLLSLYAKKAFYKLIQYANMIITICKIGHFWLIQYVNMIDTICKIGHFLFRRTCGDFQTTYVPVHARTLFFTIIVAKQCLAVFLTF